MLPHKLMDDYDYRDLSPIARDVLHLFMRYANRYQPSREVQLSYNDINSVYGFSSSAISSALKQLINKRFIFASKVGGLAHQSSKYIVSWKALGLEPSDTIDDDFPIKRPTLTLQDKINKMNRGGV